MPEGVPAVCEWMTTLLVGCRCNVVGTVEFVSTLGSTGWRLDRLHVSD